MEFVYTGNVVPTMAKKNADKGTEISHLNELLGQQSRLLGGKKSPQT